MDDYELVSAYNQNRIIFQLYKSEVPHSFWLQFIGYKKRNTTMKSIGIRATPKIVYYAIIEQDNDSNKILSVDKLVLPVSMETPDKLNFIRKTIIDIINQYQVDHAGIKITEGNSQRKSIERISIEGVVQELFSGCTIGKYFGGNISKISRLLEMPNNGSLKKIINGNDIPEELSFLEDFTDYERESILSGLAALNIE